MLIVSCILIVDFETLILLVVAFDIFCTRDSLAASKCSFL